MANWLKNNDFRIGEVRKAEDYDTNSLIPPRDGVVIEAYWSTDDKGALYKGGLIGPLFQRTFAHSVTVNIFVGTSSDVIYASVITNSL
jgi:hypothetical protein